ncbi:hypothetical protein Esti_002232 [Eimeria stiedai]
MPHREATAGDRLTSQVDHEGKLQLPASPGYEAAASQQGLLRMEREGSPPQRRLLRKGPLVTGLLCLLLALAAALAGNFLKNNIEALLSFKNFVDEMRKTKLELEAGTQQETDQGRGKKQWALFLLHAAYLANSKANDVAVLQGVKLKGDPSTQGQAAKRHLAEVYWLKHEAAHLWFGACVASGLHPNPRKDAVVQVLLAAQHVYYEKALGSLGDVAPSTSHLRISVEGDPRGFR